MADWMIWTLAGAGGLGGIALVWAALLRDRARGRLRCPKCFYDMDGSPGLVCPECGRDAGSARRLRRTRRHWRLALAGLAVMAASSAGALAPKVRRDGWLSVIPTTGLLLIAPDASYDAWVSGQHTPHPVNEELERRGAAAKLAGWQWGLAVDRLGMIEIPQRWPKGEPLWVRLQMPDWAGLTEVRVTDGAGGEVTAGRLNSLFCGTGLPHDDWEGYRQLCAAPGEEGRIELVAEVRHAGSDSWSFVERDELAPAWTRTISRRVAVTDSPGAVTAPCVDAALDAAVRGSARISCTLYRYYGRACRVRVSFEGLEEQDLAFGMRVTLLHDGKEVATEAIPTKDQRVWRESLDAAISASLTPEQYKSLSSPAGRAEWSVRITGDALLSLCDFERSRHWAGEIELSLAEAEFIEGR